MEWRSPFRIDTMTRYAGSPQDLRRFSTSFSRAKRLGIILREG